MHVLDILKNKLVEAEIVRAGSADLPLKKDGWQFDWWELFNEERTRTYILRIVENPQEIESPRGKPRGIID